MHGRRYRWIGGSLFWLVACGDGEPGSADTDASATDGEDSTTGTASTTESPDTMDVTSNDATDAPTDPSVSGTSDDSTSTPATTDPDTGSTGETGCVSNDDCDGTTPFCSGGSCIGCSELPEPDQACETEFPDTPFCAAEAGCVQCTEEQADACSGSTPVCDSHLLECVGCTYHQQCITACNLDTGECMPNDPAVWVRPEQGNCFALASGTFDQPFCTISQAVDHIVDEGGSGTIWLDEEGIHEAPGSIPANVRLAILGPEPDVRPTVFASDGNTFRVTQNSSRVYIDNVRILDGAGDAVVVEGGAQVWLDRMEISSVPTLALDIQFGGVVRMRNSIIAFNGIASAPGGPIHVNGAELYALHTTVAQNYALTDRSIQCEGANTVQFRNSIILAEGGSSIGCPGIEIDHSFIDTEGLGGDGNTVQTEITADLYDWFVGDGDWHLSAEGALLFDGIGLVEVGDIPFDIDFEPRPEPGEPTMPGADVP